MWTNAFFLLAVVGVATLIAVIIWAVYDTVQNKRRIA
jgi:hypothetical protein